MKILVSILLMAGLWITSCTDKAGNKNQAPNVPSSPVPNDGAVNVGLSPTLSWLGGDADGDVVNYELFVGLTSNAIDLIKIGDYSTTTADITGLDYSTTYYWGIDASDGVVQTSGPIWSFTTIPPPLPKTAIDGANSISSNPTVDMAVVKFLTISKPSATVPS